MSHPIPGRLNLSIAGVQVALLLAILCGVGWFASWRATALLALAYALVMSSANAMLHEAQHNVLHDERRLNDLTGIVIALFFPAPFHLLQQGHILHHVRNRSDDEAFDVYFEGDNRLWKHLQLYGVLTGWFWLVIVASNFLLLVLPVRVLRGALAFDRPSENLLQALNPRHARLVRLEALLAITLHVALILATGAPVLQYLAVLFAFGASWSALQYVHHFGTVRDVRRGARNLRTWAPLDRILLNHNWHLNHHLHPTAPWTVLPRLEGGAAGEREGMLRSYLRMWRGPRLTHDHVANRHAGMVIR